MSKKITAMISCLFVALVAAAQAAFVTADSVAVFYPAGYDATQHEPSLIFNQQPIAIDQLPANWRMRPQFSMQNGHSIAAIDVEGKVDFYGTGEVTGPLRRNGRTISLWNVDTPAYSVDGGTHLYQSHPWVMGLRTDGSAFGIIADNTWRQSIAITDHRVTFESQGPAFRVVIIERESPQALMQALGQLTGNMELPPLWALGYQQCRFSYQPDTRVMEIADLLRKHRIPSDVIWMDIDYMDGYRIFTFNPREFSQPQRLNTFLHERDFKAVYMIDPGVKVESGYFVDDQGTAGDYWVKTADGRPFEGKVWPGLCHFPDFTRQDVRTWWATLYKDFIATGIDGVWNDMNEPTAFEQSENTMPLDNVHVGENWKLKAENGDKSFSHLRFHNVYGMQMVRASRDGLLLANPQKRPFILSRSNFLGGQRYAATWTGDNLSSPEQMKLSVPMSLTLGLSGQPFSGPDIGGFCENATGELLAEWTAMGVFFPFVRNHNIKGAVDQEPWAFTPEVLDACRTAINRRYMLMPYVYTLFRESSINGMPVMRPLFMADAKDLSLRAEDRAFLLGGDLMITPNWAPAVPSPQDDTWQTLTLESDADRFQASLRQRPGSVIPMANLAQSTATMRTDSLTLLVCPDIQGHAVGQLYEDDGDGFNYRNGQYRMLSLEAQIQKRKLTVVVQQNEGKMASLSRFLRIGYVHDGKVDYSSWQTGNVATMKVKKSAMRK